MTQTFSQSTIPFKAWDLDLLVDYVLKFHHRYIRKQGEELAIRLNSLTANHPELDRVVDHFRNSACRPRPSLSEGREYSLSIHYRHFQCS